MKAIELINQFLTEDSAASISEIDLIIKVNKSLKKNQRIDLDTLREALRLCSSVQQTTEGHYWGKFEHLAHRGSQFERILFESGEPLRVSEIARDLNHRMILHGGRTINERNLGNIISSDTRFTPIGRSGEWGLQSWSLDTSTIVDLMKQSLIYKNKPATSDEIYAYVKERRPVNRNSISAYLSFHDDFSKVSRELWGLSSWSEARTAQTWNPSQVGQFVENLFKKHNAKKLPYQIVKQALMEASGFSPKQVQGLLNVNPAISTERDQSTNELYAIFQSDYHDRISQGRTRFKRKKQTLRDKVDAYVREALDNAPNNQTALSELVARLVEQFDRRDKTFYHYISDLDYIEKYTIPDTRVVMCRIKKHHQAFPFSQVEDIQSADLKQQVGRALTFLNVADVDIALFLLGKEFEATLEKYLLSAHAAGRLSHLPNGRLNLNTMIDFIQRQNVITDKGILHFLRQRRNDRAHDPMPSIKERQVMMRHAETTAGMYIDYIKFFDDLTQNL